MGKYLVRLYWLDEVFDSTPITTYTEIFIQIGQFFRRYPLTNFFAQTHTHVKLKPSFLDVSVLVESGNVLSSTSNFWQYSNTPIRSTNMGVKMLQKSVLKKFTKVLEFSRKLSLFYPNPITANNLRSRQLQSTMTHRRIAACLNSNLRSILELPVQFRKLRI